MEHLSEAKSARLLSIYSRLVRGEVLSKAVLSAQYHISEKSIQRDIASLRCFFEEELLEFCKEDKRYAFKLLEFIEKKKKHCKKV